MLDVQQQLYGGEIQRLLRNDRQSHMTDALKEVVRRADVRAVKALLARGANPFVLTDGDLATADASTPFSLLRGLDALSGPTVRAVRRARRQWLKAAPAAAV